MNLKWRQAKIARDAQAFEQSKAQNIADYENALPRDWRTALKDAGGMSTMGWQTGSSAVAGAVVGGGVDAMSGNDSITDGIAIGAGAGALAGFGGFAKHAYSLKVGSLTRNANPVSYISEGVHSQHNNIGKGSWGNTVSRGKGFTMRGE